MLGTVSWEYRGEDCFVAHSAEEDFSGAQKTACCVIVAAYGTFTVGTGKVHFACSALMFVLKDKLVLGNPCESKRHWRVNL